jgi:predicted nucleic acid-binding Zn ribbon protein
MIYDDLPNPVYSHCPLCDRPLEIEGVYCSYFSTYKCRVCDYEHQGQGNYASLVTINGESFYLDDMFDDSEKMLKKIEEIRNND